jgi:hypothetical protein
VQLSSVAKPSVTKGKGRAPKPRKPRQRPARAKIAADSRLPLDEPSNEVDVQFSNAAVQPGEDEQ